MMEWTAYVAPTQLLLDNPPKDPWSAEPIPADPTLSLVRVRWHNPNFEYEFESLEGVNHIGFPWEEVTPDVAALLASFPASQSTAAAPTAAAGPALATLSVDPPPLSVARTLRNIGRRL